MAQVFTGSLCNWAIIATTAYAGPMASGDVINENPDAPRVTPIEAGTLAEDMRKQACGTSATGY